MQIERISHIWWCKLRVKKIQLFLLIVQTLILPSIMRRVCVCTDHSMTFITKTCARKSASEKKKRETFSFISFITHIHVIECRFILPRMKFHWLNAERKIIEIKSFRFVSNVSNRHKHFFSLSFSFTQFVIIIRRCWGIFFSPFTDMPHGTLGGHE